MCVPVYETYRKPIKAGGVGLGVGGLGVKFLTCCFHHNDGGKTKVLTKHLTQ